MQMLRLQAYFYLWYFQAYCKEQFAKLIYRK